MKRYLVFCTLFFAISILSSQNDSKIEFIIKNVGVNVDGHFNKFKILASFDSGKNLDSIKGYVEVSSIETGIESRDEHLLEEDYFDLNNHAQIVLVSKQIIQKSKTSYDVIANLSIKGTTKEITIPVEVTASINQKRIESYFEINRRDFNVGGGSFVLGKTVRITVVYYQPLEE